MSPRFQPMCVWLFSGSMPVLVVGTHLRPHCHPMPLPTVSCAQFPPWSQQARTLLRKHSLRLPTAQLPDPVPRPLMAPQCPQDKVPCLNTAFKTPKACQTCPSCDISSPSRTYPSSTPHAPDTLCSGMVPFFLCPRVHSTSGVQPKRDLSYQTCFPSHTFLSTSWYLACPT